MRFKDYEPDPYFAWSKNKGECKWEDCPRDRAHYGTERDSFYPFCEAHQRQAYRGGIDSLTTIEDRTLSHSKGCSFEGCTRAFFSRGYCRAHYMQDYRGAELTPIKEKVRA